MWVGNLLIGLVWNDLYVNGINGKFYFEILEFLNINQIWVSGLIDIGLVIGLSVLLISDNFIIELVGEVNIYF